MGDAFDAPEPKVRVHYAVANLAEPVLASEQSVRKHSTYRTCPFPSSPTVGELKAVLKEKTGASDFVYVSGEDFRELPSDERTVEKDLYIKVVTCTPSASTSPRASAGAPVALSRSFQSGSAIDRRTAYYTPWADLDDYVDAVKMEQSVLITGPWQSGKTSFLYAIAQEVQNRHGFTCLNTALDEGMIQKANSAIQESEGAARFFDDLARKLHFASGKTLELNDLGQGMLTIEGMFKSARKKFFWLIDEASHLNGLKDSSIASSLLEGLRNLKQARRLDESSSSLASFALCGLPKLSEIIVDCRIGRIESVTDYKPSSPERLSNLKPPCSVDKHRSSDLLNEDDISYLLHWFASEKGRFSDIKLKAVNTEVVRELAKSIFSLTGGHKGLVGCCGVYIQNKVDMTIQDWHRDVRCGLLTSFVFFSRTYSKIAHLVANYEEGLQKLILNCMEDLYVEAGDEALRIVSDGVLIQKPNSRLEYCLSSGLLKSVLLEDATSMVRCNSVPGCTSPTEVICRAFLYMRSDSFLRPKVLNADGHPSEYILQYQFLLGLKFVLEKGYCAHICNLFVEVKERDNNGKRKCRLDLFMENGSAPKVGFELQAAGDLKSIKKHLGKSVTCKKLHKLDDYYMHYIHFFVKSSGPERGGSASIQTLAQNFPGITCWDVEFVVEQKLWVIRWFERGIWTELRQAGLGDDYLPRWKLHFRPNRRQQSKERLRSWTPSQYNRGSL